MRKSLLILAFLTAAPALAPAMPLSAKLLGTARSVIAKDQARIGAAERQKAAQVKAAASALKTYVNNALGRPEVQRLFAEGETIPVGAQPFSLSAKGLVSADQKPVSFEDAASGLLGKDWKGYLDEQVDLRNRRIDVTEKVGELMRSPEYQKALKVRSRGADPQMLPRVELVAGFGMDARGLSSSTRDGTAAEWGLRNLDPEHFKGLTADIIEQRALKLIAPRKGE